MTATTASPSDDRALIGLISAGHFFSHFFLLTLPPLFPLLRHEFGVSYAVLGGITATYATCSAISQYPLGMLADRYGARALLIGGLGLISLCFIVMGFTSSIAALYALAIVAGLADGVFHPCDYAILSARIGEKTSGRAFSIHTFGGFAGFAVAPLIIVPLAAYAGWHNAVILSGVAGLLVAAALLWHRDKLSVEPDSGGAGAGAPTARPAGAAVARAIFTSGPLLFMFGFYVFSSSANVGLINHVVSVLMEGRGIDFQAAGTALPAYLWGIIAGILAGGFAADYFRRMDFTATAGTLAAGLTLLAAALLGLPLMALFAAFFVVGFGYGVTMPSRDIVVRSLAPAGGVGQSFAFVNTGYGIGGAVGPVLVGWILDQGHTQAALVVPACLLLVSMLFTLTAVRKGPSDLRDGKGPA